MAVQDEEQKRPYRDDPRRPNYVDAWRERFDDRSSTIGLVIGLAMPALLA